MSKKSNSWVISLATLSIQYDPGDCLGKSNRQQTIASCVFCASSQRTHRASSRCGGLLISSGGSRLYDTIAGESKKPSRTCAVRTRVSATSSLDSWSMPIFTALEYAACQAATGTSHVFRSADIMRSRSRTKRGDSFSGSARAMDCQATHQ